MAAYKNWFTFKWFTNVAHDWIQYTKKFDIIDNPFLKPNIKYDCILYLEDSLKEKEIWDHI